MALSPSENSPVATPSPSAPSSSTPPAVAGPAPRVGQEIEYEKFLDCVHCGLCTSACPTYLETGDENNSPRGRIYLMRAVVDGRLDLTPSVSRHLDLCLDCRSCETACPSGVQYGRLIEPFRASQRRHAATGADDASRSAAQPASRPDWFHRWILYGIFPYAQRMRWALAPAQLLQWTGLDRLIERSGLQRWLPVRLQRMQRLLPTMKPGGPALPAFLPAIGTRRAKVALFRGCVADALFRQTHWATARVLQRNGCDVVIPPQQGCCGAIHYHSGADEPALDLALANASAFDIGDCDAVLTNVAGCGSMLKDYGHMAHELRPQDGPLGDRLAAFASRVRDVHEFLSELGLVAPQGRLPLRVVYHDACHLAHAQRVREQPRDLLRTIPGLELIAVPEADICCGAAGSYNLTEPDMSDRLASRKIEHLLAAAPQVIATGNVGCSMQLQATLRQRNVTIPVLHPLELLDASYREAPVASLR